ncbi:SMC5-SMC6 complex localization factor protein 1 isoform X4 [Esox lucius]|uniref:SMC5-SMC6 complex localization factor protein 1 isoform X4 n=1 Tax=Esox lucius TaxID=8010 RepID=UPI0014770338|nr:SMC5-SMC6 complex localization factor protein 1 isoform X4 [Esox lucius]
MGRCDFLAIPSARTIMVDTKHVFQVSGIKNLYKKGKLLEGIHQLGGKYIGGSGYNDRTTHLIVTHAPMASEKFLAACAGGKWIVNPNYVLDSAKNGSWLPEEPYELDSSWVVPGAVNPVRVWRERVTNGAVAGAFEGWRVLLIVKPTQKDIFQRILTAGKASVHSSCPSSDVAVTHVLTNHVVDYVKAQNACAPCYPTTHIAHHLLGEQVCSLMGWTWTLGETGETQTGGEPVETQTGGERWERQTGDFSGIEMEARDYISQIEEARRLREELRSLPETMSYNTPILNSQSSLVSFHNVQNLTECGFFTEALEEILTYLQPGQHPPASFLQPLMQHALHGDAKPLFYNVFHTVLRTILRNNPPRGSPSTERFFLKVLQCPQCEKGVWPYLETSFRLCMGSELTCHSFSSTASPELLRFHGDLQTFAVKLFKCDLRAANNGQAGVVESNLLNHVFWSVWDRSTLGSRPVQQLVELLVEASKWMCSVCEVQAWGAERSRRQRLVLTLQDMLGVVVDVWCQRHSRLNPSLVERSLEDLAQHLAIICQDLPLDVLEALVPGIVSTRLRMAAADSIFRMFCHRGHITLGVSYLAALGKLSAVGPGDHQSDSSSPLSEPEHTSPNLFNPGTITEMPSGLVNGAGPRKKNIPRGVNRVNAAGETVLHRACKRNQVETLLQILALPGIDVNVKDHVGWTPLHEACNHGSHACVKALLRHHPAPQLKGQVGGVSPLHDALLCGHTDIAKTLLRHAGSDLLLQKDHHGRTPLDLVSSATLRQELKQSALMGDTAMEHLGSEVRDLPFLEACSCLLKCLLLTYQLERPQVQDVPLSLGLKLARALKKHSAQRVTAGWADTQSVRLVEDMETVLGVEECLAQLVPAVTECQGAHTRLLIILLEEMKEHRAALLTNTDAL